MKFKVFALASVPLPAAGAAKGQQPLSPGRKAAAARVAVAGLERYWPAHEFSPTLTDVFTRRDGVWQVVNSQENAAGER
ncbi:MAG: hypothetical protein ACRD04_10240 [Terriglobales bacterium]